MNYSVRITSKALAAVRLSVNLSWWLTIEGLAVGYTRVKEPSAFHVESVHQFSD
jgi:hypothetical protein